MCETRRVPLIHHMTHIEHLPRIIAEGGLVCDAEAARRNLCSKSIAYSGIKERRAATPVQNLRGEKIAAGGMLSDYVPFYFSNRSPMLGAIYKRAIDDPTVLQRDVIYLVSSAEAVSKTDLTWCFTDGHGIEGLTEFYDDFNDLPKVDWDAVRTWRWGGKWLAKDPDVKRRKQAEFLVHGRFPWELIERFAVIDKKAMADVVRLLDQAGRKAHVTVEPKWYYD
jgi:ssDNA thymidine ADP-ribosyltransferase DarT-like protein